MKFTPGGLLGVMSGSLGGVTASHNRYGYYLRARTIPTNRKTDYQKLARQYLGELSSEWSGLTGGQRLSWRHWAENNPSVDALGRQMILAPNVAFIQVNNRLVWSGDTLLDEPPIGTAPAGLTKFLCDSKVIGSEVNVYFDPTPLGATEKLLVWACIADSPGIAYTEGMKRLVVISDAAPVTILDCYSEVTARLGAIVAGQTIHMSGQVLETTTGLVSAKRSTKCVVSA